MKYELLSIVIPVYNEEKTLEDILKKIDALDLPVSKEVVLVNDASKDGSLEILKKWSQKPGFILLNNDKNMGKSQSVRKGLLASSGDLVVVQDADLEYNPENLQEFVCLFQEDLVDLVYGNRFGKKNEVIYWQNWVGNRFLSFFSSIFTRWKSGMVTHDMEVCYKMSRGEIVREIASTIQSKSNFGVEPEITAKFSQYRLRGKPLRFREIPIDYFPRSIEEGKHMKAYRDGLKALCEIIRFNLFG